MITHMFGWKSVATVAEHPAAQVGKAGNPLVESTPGIGAFVASVVRSRVEGVVGRRVVRGSALGRLPLVEVGHVGCGRRSGDPLQDAQFPARRQGGEAVRLRGRSPAGRPGQRAAAEAYCRQGQNESNASKDACHEMRRVDQDRCLRQWGARVRDLHRGDPVDRTRLARSAPSPNATIGWSQGSSDPSCVKHGCSGRGETARSIIPADRRGIDGATEPPVAWCPERDSNFRRSGDGE